MYNASCQQIMLLWHQAVLLAQALALHSACGGDIRC